MDFGTYLAITAGVVGLVLMVYAFWRLGWKFPTSLDDLKEVGPPALIGGVLLLAFVMFFSAKIRSGIKLAQADKKREEYDEQKDKFNRDISDYDAQVDQATQDAQDASDQADAAQDRADAHKDAAGTLRDQADGAGDAAADALARADRLREEREG